MKHFKQKDLKSDRYMVMKIASKTNTDEVQNRDYEIQIFEISLSKWQINRNEDFQDI